jgi:hypothetical protein
LSVVKTLVLLFLLFCAGGCIWAFLPLRQYRQRAPEKVTATLSFGLLLLLSIRWTLLESGPTQFVFLGAVAIGSSFLLGSQLCNPPGSRGQRLQLPKTDLGLWAVCGAVLSALAFLCFLRPPVEWDSRSIWFLHGKMIFFAKSAGLDAGWRLKELAFSHPDYPKLNAILAVTLLESMQGTWDPLLAKGSLWILASVIALGAVSLPTHNARTRLFFFCIFVLLGRERLWNGYMDVQCAAFSLLGLLWVSPLIDDKEDDPPAIQSPFSETQTLVHLLIGLAFWVLGTQTKNEGSLSSGILMLAFFTSPAPRRIHRILAVSSPTQRARWILAGLLLVLPPLLWTWRKSTWGIVNDLQLLSPGFRSRLWLRIHDPQEVVQVLQSLFFGPNQLGLIIVVSSIALGLFRKRASRTALILFAAGIGYSIVTTAIYLGTYHDLRWHLGTSSQRVMIFPALATLLSIILLIPPLQAERSPHSGIRTARSPC